MSYAPVDENVYQVESTRLSYLIRVRFVRRGVVPNLSSSAVTDDFPLNNFFFDIFTFVECLMFYIRVGGYLCDYCYFVHY